MAELFETFLQGAGKIPGIRISREEYLKGAFRRFVKKEQTLKRIIECGPLNAGVPDEIIDKVANDAIRATAISSTAISVVSGIPGGIAMLATVPSDVLQLYVHMFIIVQKLMYLYGWKDDVFDSVGEIDDATKNFIILCFGLMFGVGAASKALSTVASKLGKKVIEKAVVKTVMKHPVQVFKVIISKVGIRTAAKLGANVGTKAVPILGGIVSGAVTLSTFIPMANKLKKFLSERVVEYDEDENEESQSDLSEE